MRIVRRVVFGKGVEKDSKIVFFGSGKVALPSLRTLLPIYPNLQVITQSSQNQKKNFNDVQKLCRQRELNWSSPITSKNDKQKRKEQWKLFIDNFQMADFGVVCSYGYMIPSRLINSFQKGLIIVHPSLLPKYKGGAPIFHAIANGDKVSGVSFIQISKQTFDAGNILHQIQVPLDPNGQYKQIESQLAEEAAKTLPFVLQNIDELRPGVSQSTLVDSVPKQQQLAPLILSNKLQLNRPADVVYNWSRALQTPRVKLLAKDKDIILKLKPEYLQQGGEVGTFKVVGKKLFVRCSDRFIRVNKWYEPSRMEQPPGIFIAQFIKSGKYPIENVRVE